MQARIFDWIDERLGTKAIASAFLDRKTPKGVGWLFTLGSAALTIFIIQLVTGAVLAMNYSPSPDHAYDSVLYIQNEVTLGWLVRGIHKWAASAMVLVLFLHGLRVFFMASYKYPRELTWVIGVFLFLTVMGLSFTGYLLPWDLKAYWATVVGTNIGGQAPLVGPWVKTILLGGQELGAVSLTRFFALHAMILPALTGLLIGLHLFMIIKQGISAPPEK